VNNANNTNNPNNANEFTMAWAVQELAEKLQLLQEAEANRILSMPRGRGRPSKSAVARRLWATRILLAAGKSKPNKRLQRNSLARVSVSLEIDGGRARWIVRENGVEVASFAVSPGDHGEARERAFGLRDALRESSDLGGEAA
jgi:hypothetical protein